MRTVAFIFLCIFFSPGTNAQTAKSKLVITPLTGNFYVYTTFGTVNGAPYPANGMYVITKAGVVIFDTPWDTTQFQPLVDSIRVRHNKKVVMCISTHFHDDRTAGLTYYKKMGIKTYTTQRTDELSRAQNKPRAEFLIANDTTFHVGGDAFQTYFPGHGHAPDNIVIWFGKEKVLYGGCLIKSASDENLGNLGDADVKNYQQAIRNVMRECQDPKFIITGHKDWTDTRSLQHTLDMAIQAAK